METEHRNRPKLVPFTCIWPHISLKLYYAYANQNLVNNVIVPASTASTFHSHPLCKMFPPQVPFKSFPCYLKSMPLPCEKD